MCVLQYYSFDVSDNMLYDIIMMYAGQFWTSRMFTKEVVGTANALVGGWGNLGYVHRVYTYNYFFLYLI